jgi:hypothetical protein
MNMDTMLALLGWWQANGGQVLDTVERILADLAYLCAAASALAAIINPDWGAPFAKLRAVIDKIALNFGHAKK